MWKHSNGKTQPPIFNTFTFKENKTDRSAATKDFTRAIERINYHLQDLVPEGLKYVVVPETQKRGALHFHQLVFNQPYIPQVYDWFDEIWGHGHVDVRAAAKDSQSLPGYLAKYLSKDMESARQFNGKRYFSSKGLLKTVSYSNRGHIEMILRSLPPGTKKMVFEKPIESQRAGKIWITRFFLPHDLGLVDTVASFLQPDTAKIVPPTMEAEDKPSPAVAP